MSIEDLLGCNKFVVDEEEAHIEIDKSKCRECTEKACLFVCPAACYTLKEEVVSFDYAGCLECGTCRVMCRERGVAVWRYPRGTFGVSFRCG